MRKLDQAALDAARQKRERQEREKRERAARLAAAGAADERNRKRIAMAQRDIERRDARNTPVLPRRSAGYESAAAEKKDRQIEPLSRYAGGTSMLARPSVVGRPSQPDAGMPYMSANDFRQNIGRTQLDAFAGAIYNAAADAVNRRSGKDLYLSAGRKQLTDSLSSVDINSQSNSGDAWKTQGIPQSTQKNAQSYRIAAEHANQTYGEQYGKAAYELREANQKLEEYRNKLEEKGREGDNRLARLEARAAQKQAAYDEVSAHFDEVDKLRPQGADGLTVRDSTNILLGYYQPPTLLDIPILGDVFDGAYQMITNNPSLKSQMQRDKLEGNDGIGFLPTVGAGIVQGGNSFNDTLLGAGENVLDLFWDNKLGRIVNPNFKNPFTALREKNAELGRAAFGDALNNATGTEKVLMNTVGNAVNSGAHMALGGIAGKAVGGVMGIGSGMQQPITALKQAKGAAAVGAANMSSFVAASMTDAYDRSEAEGDPPLKTAVRALSAGMASMIANSEPVEGFMKKMGLGIDADDVLAAQYTSSRMINNWGEGAMRWAEDTLTNQALAEGTQEVVELILDRSLDAGFTGNLMNPEFWEGFGGELKENFFYGYMGGALYNSMTLPSFAPSQQMLGQMISGEMETTPENIVQFIEQASIDARNPELQQEAQRDGIPDQLSAGDVQLPTVQAPEAQQPVQPVQQTPEAQQAVQPVQQTAEDAQEAPSGSEAEQSAAQQAKPLQTAAEAVAEHKMQQEAQQAPVQMEEAKGTMSAFATPQQGETVDGETVQVVGIDQDGDGMPYLIVRDAIGDERSEPINAVNIADEAVQELLHADAARGMDSKTLTGMMSSYDGSVPADIYAQAYGYAYRRGSVNASFAEATPDTVREVLSQQAQMDAYTAGLDRYHSRQAQTVAQPAERTAVDVRQPASRGGVVRAYTRQAWAAMPKEQRRAAAAQIEVVGAIGRRVGRQIRIVDSITTADGQRVNGRYNTRTGEIEVALNADAGAYSYVAMHELTHDLKTNHADQWDGFGRVVTDALAANGVDVDAAIAYQQQAFGYDAETALEEVICNTAPAVLQNESVLKDLYTKDKPLFERVRDWVKNLISDIRKAGESLSQRSRSWQQMDALTGDADALQQIYDKMMAIYDAGTEAEGADAAPSGGFIIEEHRFSMKAPVEETSDLLAVHNLTEENLRDTLELGGFAMPSIAVIKAEQGHSKYGPISVVFAKDTIDPETSKDNEVYGGDAWTPTFPTVTIQASEEAENRIFRKWEELRKKYGDEAARPLYGYANDLQGRLSSDGGLKGILQKFSDDERMMQLYLADSGQGMVEPIIKRTVKKIPESVTALSEAIVSGIGKEALAEYVPGMSGNHQEWIAKYWDALRPAYVRYFADQGIDAVDDPYSREVRGILTRAARYLVDGAERVIEETDHEATSKAILEKVDHDAYTSWLRELFSGVEGKKGIRNDKPWFTPSGKRRSFAQTHWDVTLENVVKAMRLEERTGVGSFGGRHIEGAAVRKYKSIADIKKDSGRLGKIDETAYDAKRREHRERFREIVEAYSNHRDFADASDVLVEAITKHNTVNGILRYINQYDDLYRPSEWIAEDLHALVEEMKNMPTGYFEAKPRRAVGFDEIAAVVVPDNLPADLIGKLTNVGANVIEYEAGNENDRTAKLNGERVGEYKFSMSDYNDDARAAEEQLGALMTMTAGHTLTDSEADRLAKRVINAVGSTVDRDTLAWRLKDALRSVQGLGRHEVAGALYAEMMPIAQDVLDSSMRADTTHEERVKPLRKWLHEHPLALTKGQKAMAEEIAGSYVDFKRRASGVRMSLNAGNTLDTVYAKLTEFDPVAYPAEATEREKLAKLLDAGETVQKVYATGMGADESVRWMADKILNTYFTLTGVQRDAQNPTSFATALRNYRNAIGAYEKTSNDLFDEALGNVLERYGRKIERGEDFDLSKLVATDEGKELYRHVLSEKQRNLRRRIEDSLRRQQRTAQIYRQSRDLLKKLEKPTDKKHVQDALQGELTRFLKAINFGSANNTTRNLAARIRALRDVMSDQNRQDNSLPYLFDPDMAAQMKAMAARLEELPSMNELSDSELAELRQMIAYASHVVAKADESFAEGRKLKISAVAGQSLDELQGRKNAKDREGWGEKLHNFLNIGQLDAFHFFDMLGNGGKKMFAALRKGLDRKIRHWAEATDYANDVIAALPKAGRKDLFAGKKAPKTSFELANGTLNLSKAQIMELYCLSKRKNALLHLYEGGIRAGDGAKARGVLVTPAEVESITNTLTAAEKQVADKLQQYMATECGAWGNETSLQLYGYRKFGEADYYPMRVDPNSVDSGISEEGRNDNLYAILNMGMAKALQEGAHNALYIGDIFDTFAKHVDNMSKYNGFAAPVADLIRWYNYRAGGDQNIQYMLESKFGKAGRDYIPTLIRNLNGEKDRSYNPGLTSPLFSHMKAAAVGRNLRVVIQQPTAILRAGDMMDYKYIVAGMVDPQKPADRTRLKEAIELAKQYSPIAKLKSMGFFETDVGNSLRTAMFDDRTAIDKVKDEGMWLAGRMDEMTFGMLWRACEAETRALHPELTGEAFYEAVGQRLSDVIDYTQVVDTTLHRSQLMRSGNALSRMSATFMSEPTKTYNMLYSSLRRMLDNRTDPIAKKHFARTIGVFALTGIVNAMAQSLIDAIRDDSDDEWWRKYLKHFFGDYSNLGEGWLQKLKNVAREASLEGNAGANLNVGTMIPYVKDVLSLMQGYDLNRTDMQSVEKLVQTAGQVGKLLTGDSTMSGWAWAKQIAGSVDSITGLGLGNALRDGYAVTNLLFGVMGKDSPISMRSEDATSTIAYDNLYKALMSGDRRSWDRLTEKMQRKGKVTKEIDSAMADRLAEDARIGEAYAAREAGYGSKVDRIRQEMMDQLPDWLPESRRREIVDKAINKLNPASAPEQEDKPLNSKLYSYDDLSAVFAGIANGTHTMEDYNLIISELVSDSTAADPGKTVQTNAKSKAKAAYIAAPAAARKRLGEVIKELFAMDDKDLQKWLD